jgi:hypothetical protein
VLIDFHIYSYIYMYMYIRIHLLPIRLQGVINLEQRPFYLYLTVLIKCLHFEVLTAVYYQYAILNSSPLSYSDSIHFKVDCRVPEYVEATNSTVPSNGLRLLFLTSRLSVCML